MNTSTTPKTHESEPISQAEMTVKSTTAPRRSTPMILVGVVVAVAALGGVGSFLMGAWGSAPKNDKETKADLAIELVPGKPSTIVIPPEVRLSLGITKNGADQVAEAKHPTQSQELVLPGSTALDPSHLYRIRARFAPARVVEIAQVHDARATEAAGGVSKFRELRPGDKVSKGELLAIFYSVDVGNKKNDLIDAISQRYLDEEILEKAEKAFRSGALPEIFMLNAQRNVEADRNAERRAVNNLRTWDIPEEDIKACYDEAERLRKLKGKERDLAKIEKNEQWPVVKLVAPDAGVVLERNVAKQEMVVDGTTNLFQIAKVDRMVVIANCPEDDLPLLQALPPKDMRWTIKTVGVNDKDGMKGTIDEISYLIDPNQHTGVIKGHIDNPESRLRAGQFISASIQLPPPREKVDGVEVDSTVEVPIDAVSEDGQTCVVFVQSDADKHEYTMRRVQLTHRFETKAFVRCLPIEAKYQPSADEQKLGMMRIEPLHKGEKVLITGVGELKAVLIDKESQPKKKDDDKGK